jgi:hypothetical protein
MSGGDAMSQRERLNRYIERVQQRLRLDASVRGAAVVAVTALLATIILTLILNAYAFPEGGLTPARIALFAVLAVVVCAGVAWPLWRLTRGRSVGRAEAAFPEFQERLLTFSEKERRPDADAGQNGLFLELLAADTLKVAGSDGARPELLAPSGRLLALLGAGVVCAGVLVWMVAARPGFMGYGASLLWTGPHKDVPPIYEVRVTPGNAAVRRNSDELVTAQVIGLATEKVSLFARYASASKWEQVAMQPQTDGAGYQFLFAGLPENVEYYVQAGAAASKHFKFRVVDLPQVKAMQVTYHYPKWTGMQTVSEEQAGDLRALEGTEAELTVTMTAPLKDGMLALDGGKVAKLAPIPDRDGASNVYRGTIHMDKDGAYHVAATDEGQPVRLSEDYFISTSKANPPSIAIDRPAGDYRASPIEEVTVGVKAGADFGLTHVSLHYSVNGGAEQTVNILSKPGAKDASGVATLSLEDFKVQPGDVVSLYATAKDNHAETKTDISFIQIDPFEREFSQSQQSGGGGGGGGGSQAQSQGDIARREKELIAATWKEVNAKGTSAQEGAAMGKTLSEAQATLKQQALALSARMQSRDLSQANDSFNSFDKDMEQAAAGMQPAADKLKAMQWTDAMPIEQEVLQALLRAEATFRQIQVAFGQQGGGGGGGGSAGRDLASLFDLEMDTQKNQYETAQTAATPAEQQAKKVDDALAKLDALAKRQEELAQKQGNQAQNFQERWQQEMLRREAEQLQREMEQMQGQQGQQGAGGQQGQQGRQQQAQGGQQGQPGQGGQAGQQSGRASSGSQSASRGTADGGADPRVTQALDRLRAANEAMGKAGAQQSAEEAKRAADRLREATDLLGGAQKQQASGKLDAMGREADRLSKQESAEADRVKKLAVSGEAMQARRAAGGELSAAELAAAEKERESLADERQGMSGDLEKLSKQMRDAARELAPTQPAASSNLRDALNGMDQTDLTNLVQRTADWLRSGINPNSNGTESTIATGLRKLDDKVKQAQQAAGGGQNGKPGQDAGTETAALDHVDKLRSEIEALSASQGSANGRSGQQGQRGKGGNGQQPGGQQGQQGGQGGQQGQGQQGQRGQSQLGRGQQGQGQSQGQGQQGQGQGQGQGGRGGQLGGGNQIAQGGRGGQAGQRGGGQNQNQPMGGQQFGSGDLRGGGGSTAANLNVDTGGQTYAATRSGVPPPLAHNPADVQRFIQQGMGELNQLRGDAKGNPAAQKDIDDLVKEMQKLDPSRFVGNPEMVEALHAKVLNDVDKLELQLQRDPGQAQAGQVRTAKAASVPAGYEDAVAEYYRRLGKGQ